MADAQLVSQDMGFSKQHAEEAVSRTQGKSLDAAIEYALTHPDPVPPPEPPKPDSNEGGSSSSSSKPQIEVELPVNPTSLADFKYTINDKDELVHTETGEKFKYLNEKHYDALGEQIERYIQQRMVKDFGMKEAWVPVSTNSQDQPQCNIFMTEHALVSSDPLVLIIQGVGKVRAGQWGRKLCFNDSLRTGSILPYIGAAVKRGFQVLVMNPNFNHVMRPAKEGYASHFNATDPQRQQQVASLRRFVRQSKASKVLIVAHSFGGTATLNLMEKRENELLQRTIALALTDSVMYFAHRNISSKAKKFFEFSTCNWLASNLPLDTPIQNNAECVCVSAGHTVHENTSSSCMESVFRFFDQKLIDKAV